MPNAVAACNMNISTIILLPLVTLSSKVTGEILIDDIHSSSYIHFFAFSYNTPDNQTERIRIRISKKRAAEYYKDISAVAGNYTIISCHGGRIEMSKQRSLSADCFALLVNTPYSATRLLCFTTLLFLKIKNETKSSMTYFYLKIKLLVIFQINFLSNIYRFIYRNYVTVIVLRPRLTVFARTDIKMLTDTMKVSAPTNTD